MDQNLQPVVNYSGADMTPATDSEDGFRGLVPTPSAGDEDKVLKGDGTWGITASKLPVGTIISYFGLTAPDGFLACDGTTYNRADYPELAQHLVTNFSSLVGDGTTTFKVPDLRGDFLRGTGGSGSTVGTRQNGTEVINAYSDTTNKLVVFPASNRQGSNFDTNGGNATGQALASFGTSSGSYTSYGTVRPVNTSVLYCISY